MSVKPCNVCVGPIELPDGCGSCIICLGHAHPRASHSPNPHPPRPFQHDVYRSGLLSPFRPPSAAHILVSFGAPSERSTSPTEDPMPHQAAFADEELFRILSKAAVELEREWAPPVGPEYCRLDEWFL